MEKGILYFKEIIEKCGLYNVKGVDNSISEAMLTEMRQAIAKWADMDLYGENDSIQSLCLQNGETMPYLEGQTTVLRFLGDILADVYTDDIEADMVGDKAVVLRDVILALASMVSEADIFGVAHTINSSILECELSPVVSNILANGVLDLKQNDLILAVISIFKIYIKSTMNVDLSSLLNFTTNESALNVLDRLKTYLPALFREDYDKDNNTLCGIRIDDYFNVKAGIIYIKKVLDDAGVGVFARIMLYAY